MDSKNYRLPDDTLDAACLVKENHWWMVSLAKSILGDSGLAEDVVQEALISALANIGGFEGRSTIKTWLRRITINHAITTLRKLKRLSEDSIDEYQPEFDSLDCRIEPTWGTVPSPESILEIKDIQDQIEAGLNSLPTSYSLLIKLRDIEGYNTKEVADFLDLSESNVKVRLHRARAALKKILEPTLLDHRVNQ